MHTVLNEVNSDTYVELFKKLIGEGNRKFLFYGPTEEANNLVKKVNHLSQDAHISIISSDAEKTSPATDKKVDNWEAIFVLAPATPRELIKKISPIHYKTNLVYKGKQADFAIVVSLHKAGTNLLAEQIKKLGYTIGGFGIDNSRPAVGQTFNQYFEKLPSKHIHFLHYLPLESDDPELWVYRDLADTREIVDSWKNDYKTPIIFNYRDPRAVVNSVVNYYMSSEGTPLHTARKIHADIMRSLPDHSSRVKYILNGYREYLQRSFRDNYWLYLHPQICKVSFESLVGKEGGGSYEKQVQATSDMMIHLSISGDPIQLATTKTFGGTRTFNKGQIDSWREDFGSEAIEMFNRLYGDIIEAYDYTK